MGLSLEAYSLASCIASLSQVLLNLAGNALKFTLEGKIMIEVKLLSHERESGLLEFSVKDTGFGIEKDKTGFCSSPLPSWIIS
jgi:signal transduction histidine kinase